MRKRTVVAHSRFLQAEIKKRLGLDAVLCYPFIDLDAYRCRNVGKTRTHRIGFYSAGERKGSKIVAEIVDRMPERQFVIIGGYSERPPDALPDNLTYWGYIPDIRQFYREIDLLLVPSVCQEPFGRVILEAAVNGIPVIANREGGIPEALGGSGVLINKEPDPAAMAEKYVVAIQRLLDDDTLYRQYSQRALARAKAYDQEQNRTSHEFYARYICP